MWGRSTDFLTINRKLNGAFIDTVNKMDIFLVELGYISTYPKSILK